jgi:hypothetical protein
MLRKEVALAAKGYEYQFIFARNAGHAGHTVQARTLPSAIVYLMQDYKPDNEAWTLR